MCLQQLRKYLLTYILMYVLSDPRECRNRHRRRRNGVCRNALHLDGTSYVHEYGSLTRWRHCNPIVLEHPALFRVALSLSLLRAGLTCRLDRANIST